MFLVELAHKTICEEIEDIKEQKKKTKQALDESQVNLRADSAKLLDHIERDTSKTEEKSKEADAATNDRKQVEQSLQGLEEEIRNTRGEIEKNKDTLREYEKHKVFMFQIYDEHTDAKKFKQKMMEEYNGKVEELREQWVSNFLEFQGS